MPADILAQTGISLADIYDVRGSYAPVVRLASEEVVVVHEMGQTIFSERLSAELKRESTGAIAQNDLWANIITDLPAIPARIVGLSVICSDASRISRATISLRSPIVGAVQEMPIWTWDPAEDDTISVLLVDDNGAAANKDSLRMKSGPDSTPSLVLGSTGPQATVPEIAFRGRTTAFGAGDVTTTMIMMLAFANLEGISSYGLPIPSW